MKGNRFLYLVVAAFLCGNLIFIYIKYNADKSVDNLVSGNQLLLNEFTFSQRLQSLESNVAQLENKLHAAVNAEQQGSVQNATEQAATVQAELGLLQSLAAQDSSDNSIDAPIAALADTVQTLLRLNNAALRVYKTDGPPAARALLATDDFHRLAASIFSLTRRTISRREAGLTQATETVDKSVTKVQQLGTFLIVFVLSSAALLFWYVVNTIRTQSRLLAQVSASEKKAREAAVVKENFLANMSHEIRTPLNAVLGFAGLLEQKQLDAEAKQYVQTLRRSGESLLAIVNDVLDLSKIEAGMMRIESAPFSVQGLAHSVETLFSQKAREKGLRFAVEVDPALPAVLEGDATRLTQILVNLIGNALKFTQQGSVQVALGKKSVEGQILRLQIRVADTGIGIAPEKITTIFERFQQAEESVTRKYGGTGLGLAIVRDLVELQGGTISVQSRPGEGAAFALEIPYKISAQSLPGDVLPEAPAAPLPGKNIKVLVVEDNEVNQSLMQHLFAQWGLGFALAENGRVAVERLRRERFDAVLMDVQMPEMDGYSAAQAIRNELHLTVPVIAMTAHAMAGEREKCLSAGMNDYLSKPVREADLKETLLRYAPQAFNGTKQNAAESEAAYKHIDLSYLKEVSAGNKAYEKKVTQQFLKALPQELEALQTAWTEGDAARLKRIAHNLKTTLSVMGLNEPLAPCLDRLEEKPDDKAATETALQRVVGLCQQALPEAEHFLATLS